MLYVISNPDHSLAREKAAALVASLKHKRPDASLVSLDHESATAAALESLTATQGLFAPKIIVRLDVTGASSEEVEEIAESAKECAESENIFVVSTGKLTVKNAKAFEKYAEKLTVADAKPKKEESGFPFAFAQSLTGSKTRLFALYHEELGKGAEPEALHGVLFWKAKQMLAKDGGTGARRIARGLVDVYHRSRRGDGELRLLLEKFILSL